MEADGTQTHPHLWAPTKRGVRKINFLAGINHATGGRASDFPRLTDSVWPCVALGPRRGCFLSGIRGVRRLKESDDRGPRHNGSGRCCASTRSSSSSASAKAGESCNFVSRRDQISTFLCCNQIVFSRDEAETLRPIMINLERVDRLWPNARHSDRTIISFEGHRITIDRPFAELVRR